MKNNIDKYKPEDSQCFQALDMNLMLIFIRQTSKDSIPNFRSQIIFI